MQNSITKTIVASATTTAMLSALFGPEREVNRAPRRITPEMPYYVAQTNRILWERWETAAHALSNLRAESEAMDSPRLRRINGKAISNILRAFPNIDQLFPADAFEPEYDESMYDCEPSNRFEGVAL